MSTNTNNKEKKFDIYQEVTNRIIAQLEQGVIPWKRPWIGNGVNVAVSYDKSKPYSLLNQFLLGDPGEYITFKRCQELGGKIKKGSKSRMVVFWKMLEKPSTDEGGNPVIGADGRVRMKSIPYLKYQNVFHISDCEGIESKLKKDNHDDHFAPIESDEYADTIINGYLERSGVTMRFVDGGRAYYQPSTDSVTLPPVEKFISTAEYYSTAFHELTHSTGHASRLNRLSKDASFGSESYSKEELVAEIGAASLLGVVNLETESSFMNSAAYIQSWLKALRNDKTMIVSSAGRAEKAVHMILGDAAA